MKLTTKMRYGTRVMLELALHYERGPMSLSEIAEREQLSEKYIESLASILRSAGLLQSTRGAQGGYRLARPPEQITLRDIFEVLEGSEPFVPCTADPSACQRGDWCVTQEVWAKMYHASIRILEATTLADLVTRSWEKQGQAAVMYNI
ncbi:MAG: RrF2 family transcriptional regulator [Anaerolineae bacterium]